ncbi:hypothetical protein BH11MYX3_BH11MYX3_47690 [soil metagenome]
MVRRAIIALVLAATGTARAHPILIDEHRVEEPPAVVAEPIEMPPLPDEPLHTRLGLRTGAGWFELRHRDVTAVGLLQLTGDLEVDARTRMFGEYEFLILSEAPPEHSAPAMDSVAGLGHRFNTGISHEVLGKTVRGARFNATAEVGGGLAFLTGAIGATTVLHGFVGLRFGFEVRIDRGEKRLPSFAFELLFRGMAVGDGPGFLFGLGMQWGS